MSLTNPYKKQTELIRKLRREKPERLFGIERWFSIVLAVVLMALPAMFIRWVGGLSGYLGRKKAVDGYALAKPAALLLVLYSGMSFHVVSAGFASVALIDLYAYLLGLVFLRRFYSEPASYRRSVLLLGVNFVETLLAFAVLYLYSGSIGRAALPVRAWSEAVYFSVITSATVGYGDIAPFTPTGRSLVAMQVLSSLFFMAIIVATFVGRLFDNPNAKGPNKRLHPTAAGREPT